MPRKLPPLNAVKAFESAARHLSFTRAAEELSVTQGAISKQIRTLEAYLNTPLFERQSGGISLTAAGAEFLPAVSSAFDTLSFATRQLKQAENAVEPLLIDAIPSFASLWLLPRLGQFQEQYPTIKVDIITGDGPLNFTNSEADLAIRCLRRDQVPEGAELVKEERLLILASPALLQKQPVRQPADLLALRLLPHNTRPGLWTEVLESLGVDPHDAEYGAGWNHFFMTIQAVRSGVGVGLVPDFLAEDLLLHGEAVNVLDLAMDSGYAYYWLSPGYKSSLSKVQRFHHWLAMNLTPV